jgi:RHS repeat-associated protein
MPNYEPSTASAQQPAVAEGRDQSRLVSAPQISLPKGGGAIRGIGEKFGANPVTGTASTTVPIATSPGRSGFGPQLALSYDSGAGNGPFGFGWHVTFPSVTRKTDKGLPKYRDEIESDVFILSDAEDLVPVLVERNGEWQRHQQERTLNGTTYAVRRYRPRIEGLFARIEQWTDVASGAIHWRSITRENVTSLYGTTPESRIVDPRDCTRIFKWCICESYDDKGNSIVYEYKREDDAGVDLGAAHEAHRGTADRTANRYLKRIKYGNRFPRRGTAAAVDEWLFEVVFDYGEHDVERPSSAESAVWLCRRDAFSSYRSGFEVRTYRLCQRVLLFHHFPEEPGVGRDCLVSSTTFTYRSHQPADGPIGHPVASFIVAVTRSGYKRSNGGYISRSLPPLEFEYSEPVVHDQVQTLDRVSLENLPSGLESGRYNWIDLDGEGLSGILTEQANAWFYKRNRGAGRFEPIRVVEKQPSLTAPTGASQHQLLDLAGDGQLDLVLLGGAVSGFYERTEDSGWGEFTPFKQLPNIRWDDPNLRFVDLDGDGHADLLITQDDVLTWYPSLAEGGFAEAERVRLSSDERHAPRVLFSDTEQSIFLADMSGDGSADVVRIRNGQVCYWPNLGYGRFGAQVVMSNLSRLDWPDAFDPRRVLLADIDGSGTSDLIYLGADGVTLYFNQCGNGWSPARRLEQFPPTDRLSSATAVDLLGNGTACLVWSSALPGSVAPLRFIDLMGGQKPHLLTRIVNNLGAETRVHYAPSTRFYIADREAGAPWITRLPFPVHVVERVETYDHVSRNRFVTRYAYHHGFYDGVEREFRGFGRVDQWDTEEFAVLTAGGDLPTGDNVDASSHAPPVWTKTWFHTGAYLSAQAVSRQFEQEYYREEGLTEEQHRAMLLKDTVLPERLSESEEREAARTLKGSILRQEVYALDGSDKERHPYRLSERSYRIRYLQPKSENRHAVFFSHHRELIDYQYERHPRDPRVTHALALDVDDYGNVLKEARVAYGRRGPDPDLAPRDQRAQARTHITYTESDVTNAVDQDDDHRTPLPSEARTYELTGYLGSGYRHRFQAQDFVRIESDRVIHVFDNEIAYEDAPTRGPQRRIVERVRTLYRPDDFGTAGGDPRTLLPVGQVGRRALAGETYKLAFTAGLLAHVYRRSRDGASEYLVPNAAEVLGALGPHGGGYVDLDGDGSWWIPSGRVFYTVEASTAEEELEYAREHFFLPHRYRDAFHTADHHTESVVIVDKYDLLTLETRDALGNRTTAGERDESDAVTSIHLDYRVLQPALVTDPNRNRMRVAFDALGMVVGTAIMGKREESQGDSLDDFDTDPVEAVILEHLSDPLRAPHDLLQRATTRLVQDVFAYHRTRHHARPQPAVVCMLARETHESDLKADEQTAVQHRFTYSDGFGREIQVKSAAESGPLEGGTSHASLRWIGSGWTVFNNKGKPVRKYEAFFTATHTFESANTVGVSPILCYDPLERVVAVVHPNRTWEKIVFDAWRQETWDVNDTVLLADPRIDRDVGGVLSRLQTTDYLPTWHALRTDSVHTAVFSAQYPDPRDRAAETAAAEQTQFHAATPTIAHADSLGRTFLTVAHNRFRRAASRPTDAPTEELYPTRLVLDIEGNQREAIDAKDRVVMRYDYDMVGDRIHQSSLDAGERWMLNDVAGKPLYAWDSRSHRFHTIYDTLRRPSEFVMRDAANPEVVLGRTVYGDTSPNAASRNVRGKVTQLFDQSGVVTNDEYDFKGNLTRSERQIAESYDTTLDWSSTVALERDAYASRTRYDALNRATQMIAPHSRREGAGVNVIQPVYNRANLLKQVHAWVNHVAEPEARLDPATAEVAAVLDIEYDAKGQRTRVAHGNGAVTTYQYDPQTFRLNRLATRRPALDFPEDCPEPSSPHATGCHVQNFHYTYDPAGNITLIRDEAQKAIFFRNQRVDPGARYTYDAVYRLIEATGREHLGRDGELVAHSPSDAERSRRSHPNDGSAMARYCERYVYDAVGNITEMVHRRSGADAAAWRRTYGYNEATLIDDGVHGPLPVISNRLSSTTLGNLSDVEERYVHDPHGNMVRMPHLGAGGPAPNMHWDYRDQLRRVDLGGGGTAYYSYDGAGQRVRRVWVKSAADVEQRLYLGGFEIYCRRYGADRLERETLHLTDNERRVALIETRTVDTSGTDPTPAQLVRYQFNDHLGSTMLELDDRSHIISYSEYTPYGSTSFEAVRSQTELPKRYRYTGKERDEESGLYFHGARYYAPWLARWTSVDPALLAARQGQPVDQTYQYVACRPTVALDPDGRIVWFAVIGIVAIATLTIESDANAPTSDEDARRAKPSVSEGEFVARTAVIGVSWFAGGAFGDKILLGTGSKVLAGGGGGMFGGLIGAPGDLFVHDAFRGEFSSPGDYGWRTAGGVLGGGIFGAFLGGFSRVVSGPAQAPPGGFGWHNVFGVPSMRPGRAADIAEAFEGRFGEAPEGMYVVGSRAERYTTGKWPDDSSPLKSDIDLVIQSDVPNIDKWTPEGFEFLKEINPGKVPPGVTGIGTGPGKTFIGGEPGEIPKGGLVDPFIGPSSQYPTCQGPAIKVWPPPPPPPPQFSALAGPIFDRVWQWIWSAQPQPSPATP